MLRRVRRPVPKDLALNCVWKRRSLNAGELSPCFIDVPATSLLDSHLQSISIQGPLITTPLLAFVNSRTWIDLLLLPPIHCKSQQRWCTLRITACMSQLNGVTLKHWKANSHDTLTPFMRLKCPMIVRHCVWTRHSDVVLIQFWMINFAYWHMIQKRLGFPMTNQSLIPLRMQWLTRNSIVSTSNWTVVKMRWS